MFSIKKIKLLLKVTIQPYVGISLGNDPVSYYVSYEYVIHQIFSWYHQSCDFLSARCQYCFPCVLPFSLKLIRRRMAVGICDVCMHSHSLLTMPTWGKYLHELNVSKYTDFKMRHFCFFNYILCSKQSMCIFNVKKNQSALQEMFHPPTYSWYPKIAFPAGLVGQLSSPLISLSKKHVLPRAYCSQESLSIHLFTTNDLKHNPSTYIHTTLQFLS